MGNPTSSSTRDKKRESHLPLHMTAIYISVQSQPPSRVAGIRNEDWWGGCDPSGSCWNPKNFLLPILDSINRILMHNLPAPLFQKEHTGGANALMGANVLCNWKLTQIESHTCGIDYIDVTVSNPSILWSSAFRAELCIPHCSLGNGVKGKKEIEQSAEIKRFV